MAKKINRAAAIEWQEGEKKKVTDEKLITEQYEKLKYETRELLWPLDIGFAGGSEELVRMMKDCEHKMNNILLQMEKEFLFLHYDH